MKIGPYETHPAADIFPLMVQGELAELVEDIREHGLQSPVVLHEGKVLDGRNRLRACYEACVRPEFREYVGDDPIGFVVSLNVKRRHLDESQRAMAAARGIEAGVFQNFENACAVFRVSHQSVYSAMDVLGIERPDEAGRGRPRADATPRKAVPEIVEAVERGEVKVSAAAEVARLPEPEQRAVIEQGPKAVREKAKEQREERKAKREPAPSEPAPKAAPRAPERAPERPRLSAADLDHVLRAAGEVSMRTGVSVPDVLRACLGGVS